MLTKGYGAAERATDGGRRDRCGARVFPRRKVNHALAREIDTMFDDAAHFCQAA